MLHAEPCARCEKHIPKIYPGLPDWCEECQIDAKIKGTVNMLPAKLLPDNVKLHIAKFLIKDQTKRARVKYLEYCLLSTDESNIFRHLVYWYNGRAGNISQSENILDRILSYI